MEHFLSRFWSTGILLAMGCCYCLDSLEAGPTRVQALLNEAEVYERRADWEKACELYESALRLQRDSVEAQVRYQACVRRVWQGRRHKDVNYRREVLTLEYSQSLRLYTTVRDTLLEGSLDKKKLDAGKLFAKGLEEFDAALLDPLFRQTYLPDTKHEDIQTFRRWMHQTWEASKPKHRQDAMKQLREVALAAQQQLQLNSTIVVMEFACGACYALDEYTVYLTPHQLRELCHSFKTEVGIGLALIQQDGKVLIQDVARFSPAAELVPPLSIHDELVRIDKRDTATLSLDAIQELLEGADGSIIELELMSIMGPRIVQLRRRAVFNSSVNFFMKTECIGYVQVASFQESTLQEVEAALSTLSQTGMKGLILDLRGNSGGVFESAIEVARRFLATGIITSTQHQDPKFNTVYHARNLTPFAMPVYVLIDADTASAAEVLAGALKENQRAKLVGQTTFGKGCTQCILKLPNSATGIPTGGLRVTVSKFYSPRGEPYTGRGVVPDLFAMPEDSMMNDVAFDLALREIERELLVVR